MRGENSLQFKKITSKDNNLIKLIAKLNASGRSRKEHGLFVIEGLRLCRDAAENGYRFSALVMSETALCKYPKEAELFCGLAEQSYAVSDSLFSKIADTKSPQGIICLCKYNNIGTYNINRNGKYIALQNIQDPSNLGAVARTAEALGLDGIIASGVGCDPYSPKSLRASMGALLRLPVIVAENFREFLQNSGLSLYACVVSPDAQSVAKTEFKSGSAAIVGNEANGLTQDIIDISVSVTIPMRGRAESLNAAVAASIVMWEMQR